MDFLTPKDERREGAQEAVKTMQESLKNDPQWSWQPIDSHPEDNYILLGAKGLLPVVGMWNTLYKKWFYTPRGIPAGFVAEYWMYIQDYPDEV